MDAFTQEVQSFVVIGSKARETLGFIGLNGMAMKMSITGARCYAHLLVSEFRITINQGQIYPKKEHKQLLILTVPGL